MDRTFKAKNRTLWIIALVTVVILITSLITTSVIYVETEGRLSYKTILLILGFSSILTELIVITIIIAVNRVMDISREVKLDELSITAISRRKRTTISYSDIKLVAVYKRKNSSVTHLAIADRESWINLSFFQDYDEIIELLKEKVSSKLFEERRL